MDIVTTMQHRVLAFINACNGSGYLPSEAEVTLWIDSPQPLEPTYRTKTVDPVIDLGIRGFADFYKPRHGLLLEQIVGVPDISFDHLTKPRQIQEQTSPGESSVEHLQRLTWIEKDNGGLCLTKLGRAMLRAAESESHLLEDLTVLHLGAGDPLAYPLLLGRLSAAGEGLLVDPYLKPDQLLNLVQRTTISRILVTGKRAQEQDRVALVTLLEGLQSGGRIELRASDELHDRLLIDESGTVSMLGTSLNGVGRTSTVLMELPSAAADPLGQRYEEIWETSRVLAPSRSEVEDEQPEPES